MPVAWDGILQDDALDDGVTSRHQGDLYRRVSQVLEWIYGDQHTGREGEIAQALGVSAMRDWLPRPDRFFKDHLSRTTNSRRKAPIYWPLSTASGGFTLWLYYPRLSAEMLAAAVNRLRANLDAVRREETRLLSSRRAGTLPQGGQGGQARLDRIAAELPEREALLSVLRDLVDRGFSPHLDDEALARCRTEKDLAIAHDRLNLYTPPPAPKRRAGTQLSLPRAEEARHE